MLHHQINHSCAYECCLLQFLKKFVLRVVLKMNLFLFDMLCFLNLNQIHFFVCFFFFVFCFKFMFRLPRFSRILATFIFVSSTILSTSAFTLLNDSSVDSKLRNDFLCNLYHFSFQLENNPDMIVLASCKTSYTETLYKELEEYKNKLSKNEKDDESINNL